MFRGIAILAVVLIHISSRFLRHVPLGSSSWMVFATINRSAQFAVPGFLMLSALVNTASLLRRFDIRRFYCSRLVGVLWPYLLWSAIYIEYQSWPHLAAVDAGRAWQQVLLGKAYPHLYFLWVLLQLMVALPLLVLLVRRRPPFWITAVISLLLTVVFYVVNKRVMYSAPDLIRSVLDYIPPVALGVWMGGRRDSWPETLERGWALSLLISAAGAVYVPLAIRADLLGGSVDGLHYQAGWWSYTTGVSFLLMALSYRCEKAGPLSSLLQYLGRCSMQIYLAHLLVLLWFDANPGIFTVCGAAGAFGVYLAGAIIGPVILAEICTRARISPLLFGR